MSFELREIIQKIIRPLPDSVCVATSAGIDSGIAELVGTVTTEILTPGKKTPIGAYNILQKLGRLGEL